MKKPTLWLIISSFISHTGFSDPYVWQDYDDFSGSSLDTRKWEIGYWDGAQAPSIENGKAHLYGTGVGVGSIVPPSSDELVGMPPNGTNQSFLVLKDDLIRGVEAEISLDSTFSGIYLGIMEAVGEVVAACVRFDQASGSMAPIMIPEVVRSKIS